MATPQYSRAGAHSASVNEPDPLESRAEVPLGETIKEELASTPIEGQLDCVNRVTSAVIAAAKRHLSASHIQHIELTDRQRQVLTMLDAGEGREAIAAEIGRSEETVKWHVWNLNRKFEVQTHEGLVRKARAKGVI